MIDDTPARLGARIREARIHKGFSLQKLADTIGVSHQQIWKYEVGKNSASVHSLRQFARALGVPLSFFFDGIDQPSATPLLKTSGARTALLAAYDELDSAERGVLVSIAKSMTEARCMRHFSAERSRALRPVSGQKRPPRSGRRMGMD